MFSLVEQAFPTLTLAADYIAYCMWMLHNLMQTEDNHKWDDMMYSEFQTGGEEVLLIGQEITLPCCNVVFGNICSFAFIVWLLCAEENITGDT